MDKKTQERILGLLRASGSGDATGELPKAFHFMKARIPGLTQAKFLEFMDHLMNTRAVDPHILNEVWKLKTDEEKSLKFSHVEEQQHYSFFVIKDEDKVNEAVRKFFPVDEEDKKEDPPPLPAESPKQAPGKTSEPVAAKSSLPPIKKGRWYSNLEPSDAESFRDKIISQIKDQEALAAAATIGDTFTWRNIKDHVEFGSGMSASEIAATIKQHAKHHAERLSKDAKDSPISETPKLEEAIPQDAKKSKSKPRSKPSSPTLFAKGKAPTQDDKLERIQVAQAILGQSADQETGMPKQVPVGENFKRWFGKSKVVDEQGRPKKVFHGTDQDFEAFDPAKSNPQALYGPGHYFTEDEEMASSYADGNILRQQTEGEKKKRVVEAHLSIQNPFDADWHLTNLLTKPGMAKFSYNFISDALGGNEKATEKLKQLGYDGITHKAKEGGGRPAHRVWIAFNPNSIKQDQGEHGAYDPADARMKFAKGKPPTGDEGQPAIVGEDGPELVKEGDKAEVVDRPKLIQAKDETAVIPLDKPDHELNPGVAEARDELLGGDPKQLARGKKPKAGPEPEEGSLADYHSDLFSGQDVPDAPMPAMSKKEAQDTGDFFGVKPEQGNLYQEGMNQETGKWVGDMPQAPAKPLYGGEESGFDDKMLDKIREMQPSDVKTGFFRVYRAEDKRGFGPERIATEGAEQQLPDSESRHGGKFYSILPEDAESYSQSLKNLGHDPHIVTEDIPISKLAEYQVNPNDLYTVRVPENTPRQFPQDMNLPEGGEEPEMLEGGKPTVGHTLFNVIKDMGGMSKSSAEEFGYTPKDYPHLTPIVRGEDSDPKSFGGKPALDLDQIALAMHGKHIQIPGHINADEGIGVHNQQTTTSAAPVRPGEYLFGLMAKKGSMSLLKDDSAALANEYDQEQSDKADSIERLRADAKRLGVHIPEAEEKPDAGWDQPDEEADLEESRAADAHGDEPSAEFSPPPESRQTSEEIQPKESGGAPPLIQSAPTNTTPIAPMPSEPAIAAPTSSPDIAEPAAKVPRQAPQEGVDVHNQADLDAFLGDTPQVATPEDMQSAQLSSPDLQEAPLLSEAEPSQAATPSEQADSQKVQAKKVDDIARRLEHERAKLTGGQGAAASTPPLIQTGTAPPPLAQTTPQARSPKAKEYLAKAEKWRTAATIANNDSVRRAAERQANYWETKAGAEPSVGAKPQRRPRQVPTYHPATDWRGVATTLFPQLSGLFALDDFLNPGRKKLRDATNKAEYYRAMEGQAPDEASARGYARQAEHYETQMKVFGGGGKPSPGQAAAQPQVPGTPPPEPPYATAGAAPVETPPPVPDAAAATPEAAGRPIEEGSFDLAKSLEIPPQAAPQTAPERSAAASIAGHVGANLGEADTIDMAPEIAAQPEPKTIDEGEPPDESQALNDAFGKSSVESPPVPGDDSSLSALGFGGSSKGASTPEDDWDVLKPVPANMSAQSVGDIAERPRTIEGGFGHTAPDAEQQEELTAADKAEILKMRNEMDEKGQLVFDPRHAFEVVKEEDKSDNPSRPGQVRGNALGSLPTWNKETEKRRAAGKFPRDRELMGPLTGRAGQGPRGYQTWLESNPQVTPQNEDIAAQESPTGTGHDTPFTPPPDSRMGRYEAMEDAGKGLAGGNAADGLGSEKGDAAASGELVEVVKELIQVVKDDTAERKKGIQAKPEAPGPNANAGRHGKVSTIKVDGSAASIAGEAKRGGVLAGMRALFGGR